MSWVAAIGAAGAVAGGLLGNKAKKKQAKAQKKALKYQIFSDQQARNDLAPYRDTGNQALNAYARAMGLPGSKSQPDQNLSVNDIYSGRYYNNVPGSTAPDAAGYPGIAQFYASQNPTAQASAAAPEQDRYGGFYASPGYQFRLDEGGRAVDRSASARGLLLSGAQNKALTRFGQGEASNEFGNYTNRLAQLAGFGSGAASQTSSQSVQSGNAVSNALNGMADTRASGYLNAANTVGNVSNIFSDYMARRGTKGATGTKVSNTGYKN
jgi:hypothetical protein